MTYTNGLGVIGHKTQRVIVTNPVPLVVARTVSRREKIVCGSLICSIVIFAVAMTTWFVYYL